ncbi:hypothetical protein BaRGS_00034416 [Batillaria attramentaria]|uniref:C1q domain-containing protein n=1 Tax=Batillaria attramentaria TaxID=370345 RepID=A0ABD0JHC5_9CAEN
MYAWQFFSLAVGICASGLGVDKRSDDFDPQAMLTLIHQQADTIANMQAKLTALENSMSAAQAIDSYIGHKGKFSSSSSVKRSSRAASEVDPDLNNPRLLSKLLGLEDVWLAFTAHMSQSGVAVGTSSPFLFDAVVTNIGNGYNPHTGVFIAPYNGIYAFFFSIMNHGSSALHVAIEKTGTVLASTYAQGISSTYDKASVMATVSLQKGDQVFVRRVDGDTNILGEAATMFSGFLISPEP